MNVGFSGLFFQSNSLLSTHYLVQTFLWMSELEWCEKIAVFQLRQEPFLAHGPSLLISTAFLTHLKNCSRKELFHQSSHPTSDMCCIIQEALMLNFQLPHMLFLRTYGACSTENPVSKDIWRRSRNKQHWK